MPYLGTGKPPGRGIAVGQIEHAVDPETGERVGPHYIWSGTDWLVCNGEELRKEDEPVLYAAIGRQFGGSAARFTFCLPRLPE